MNKLTAHDLSLIVSALANDMDRYERDNCPRIAEQIRHTLFKVQAQRANAERRAKREAKNARKSDVVRQIAETTGRKVVDIRLCEPAGTQGVPITRK